MKFLVALFSVVFAIVVTNSVVADNESLVAEQPYISSGEPAETVAEEPEDPSTRIYNGNQVQAGNFPYQAGLITQYSRGSGVCGGSLISATRVLTAAHCWWDGKLQGLSMTVVLGSLTLYSGGLRLDTSTVDVHSGWNYQTLENDIAMVYLPQVVQFSDYIKPVALAPASWFEESFFEDTVVASGFGRVRQNLQIAQNAVLRYVHLQVVANPRCRRFYGDRARPSVICAQNFYGSNVCPGDSGGPLTITKNNRLYLFGVVSYAPIDCETGGPSGYTRVTSFLNWIQQRL